jgi:ferredoxin
MTFLTTSKSQLESAVQRMLEESVVYGVKRKTPSYAFGRLFEATELRLDHEITLLSPNQYFIPPQATLLNLKIKPEMKAEGVVDNQPSVIIGVHSYDLHALKLLDAVFLGNLKDTNYQIRRTATAIIGVDCLNPWPYSFAASMGTALPPEIFDLWLTDLGDEYLVEVGSDEGKRLSGRYFNMGDASRAYITQREKLREESLKLYKLSMDMPPSDIPKVLDEGWKDPMWEELGQKCFSCGSCTSVCPTCVCFDVRDMIELNLRDGERYRRWDSCMFDGFNKVATGENFRPTGVERLRHRLHRKGKYMLERWGQLGCVGCGRCIHACLVDIASPVYAYNRLAKGKKS